MCTCRLPQLVNCGLGQLGKLEAGDAREIRSTGRGLLKTVSVYLPPAYDREGEVLPPGKP